MIYVTMQGKSVLFDCQVLPNAYVQLPVSQLISLRI